jgi:hypothetical protein
MSRSEQALAVPPSLDPTAGHQSDQGHSDRGGTGLVARLSITKESNDAARVVLLLPPDRTRVIALARESGRLR